MVLSGDHGNVQSQTGEASVLMNSSSQSDSPLHSKKLLHARETDGYEVLTIEVLFFVIYFNSHY